jgi:hypothetical protein
LGAARQGEHGQGGQDKNWAMRVGHAVNAGHAVNMRAPNLWNKATTKCNGNTAAQGCAT